MNRNVLSASLLIGMGALGCSQPQFTYYVPPGISVQKFETIAIDPRTDYAFIIEGKRQIKDPEVQNLVLAELQAKGYRLAPPDQADLWVNAVLLIKAFQSNAGSSGGHGSMVEDPLVATAAWVMGDIPVALISAAKET